MRPLTLLRRCAVLSAFAVAVPAAAQVLDVDFDSNPYDAARVVTDGGVAGAYGTFDASTQQPPIELDGPIGPKLTIAMWVRADEWPTGDSEDGFSATSPAILLALTDAQDAERLVQLRVLNGRPELAVAKSKGQFSAAGADQQLPTGRWFHLAAVHDAATIQFYIDGKKVVEASRPPPFQRAEIARIGGLGKRRHVGDLDQILLYDGALSAAQIKDLADGKDISGPLETKPAPWKPEQLQAKYEDLQLQVVDDALVELAEGSSAQANFVPWDGSGDASMLIRSFSFNPKLRLLRKPTWDPEAGRLIFDSYEEVKDTRWADQLGGGPFWTIDRGEGMFDLIAQGGTPLYFRNVGQPGEPEFEPPYPVLVDGYPFSSVLPEIDGNPVATDLADIDGDGVHDLLFCKLEKWEFPDGHNFWQHKVSRYAGKGRSWSINGEYLADTRRSEFFWARGQRSEDGAFSFSTPLPVYAGREDFPLIWKGPGSVRAAVATIGGERHIVLWGSLDQLLAVPFDVEGDVVRCGDPVAVLPEGQRVEQVYMPHHMSVRDLDGDGNDEILLTGNPGSAAVLYGDKLGEMREAIVYARGGALRSPNLVVPVRVEWNGDAYPDVLTSDASGNFDVWPGTSDPLVYGQPESITLDGKPFQYRPADDASIQGDDERRWAYTNPLVTDWNGDGKLDIVFGELGPQLNVALGKGGNAVGAPEPIRTADGKVWQVAWRQRPALVSETGDERLLLVQDWDGDFALASFDPADPMTVRSETKLAYESGGVMRVSGPGGFWGRGKPAVADWDGDGDWDIVYGGHGGNNRYVDPALERLSHATTMWFENVGTSEQPRFARPELLTLKGEPIQVGKHVASAWPTDLDGDGELDLIFGTDDGIVYAMPRDDIVPRPLD